MRGLTRFTIINSPIVYPRLVDQTLRISNLSFIKGMLEIQRFTCRYEEQHVGFYP